MKKNLLIVIFLSMVTLAFGQDRTVTGKVTDEMDGSALPGVNVLLKGTTRGTVTDATGVYSLQVPSSGGTLVFSFIGLATQEVEVGTRSQVDLVMASDATALSEVVVVGYGTQKKESITGSVSSLGGDKLEQVPMASFEQSLQGSMAGVQVVGSDGSPGGNVQIRVRGIGSITASSEPLYVIDGMIVETGSISDINGNGGASGNVMASLNPNDIENVTVLKDAASTSIYGSRGANGVILITTKSGKKGLPRVSLKTLVGFNSVANNNFLAPLNADQYTELYLEGYLNRGETLAQAQTRFDNTFEQQIDPSTGQPTDTDWLDAITRTGVTQSYDLSVGGGTDNLKYFFSGAYYDQQSHIIGTDLERLSSRINLEFKMNEFVTFTNNVSVSSFTQNGMTDGSAWANPLYNAFLLSPIIPIRDAEGRFNAEHQNYFPMGGNNPVGALSGDDIRTSTQTRITDNFAMSVKFLENFTFKSQWNFDIIQLDENQYKNRRYGDGRNVGGYSQNSVTKNNSWIGTQTLNYGVTLAENHNIDAMVGYEAQSSNRQVNYGYGESFPNDKLKTLASAATAYDASQTYTEYTFASMFMRANYDYKGKYFVSGSIRRDGSSRFGANNRWGNFWSVGGGWLISNESFLNGVGFINSLKIRGSYGTTGNAGIGNFPSVGLYGYGGAYDNRPGGFPSQVANPNLGWEKQSNFNIGVDFALISNRLNGTIDYFTRNSTDLILDVPISRTTGFIDITQNFGAMKNTGVEVALNGDVIRTADFTWNIGFNVTFIKNEITDLVDEYIDGTKLRKEGLDFQSFYLYDWAGVDQSNGDPLWYKDETRTETTNTLNEAERFLIDKSATPDYYGGITTSLRYKGITLDAQFNYSQGNYIYYSEERFIHGDGALTPRSTSTYIYENRWVPGSTDAKSPRFRWGGNNGSNAANTSRWLHDGSFVRLRNLTVAYSLPASMISKLKMQSVRVYARGTNLLTITKEKDLFMDPEQSINGINGSTTPAIKTVSLGIDIGF